MDVFAGTDIPFRATAAVLVVVALAISGTYRHRAARTGGEITADDGSFRVLRLVGLLFAVALLAALLAPRWVAWAAMPVPTPGRYAGALLSAVTLPVFVWIFRTLGDNVTPTSATRVDHALVTTGPYRWARHPLYTTATAFWAGICLLVANWMLAGLLAVGLLGVAVRTPLEEQRLADAFGEEYVAYRERTGRYVPRLRRAP